ncbi:MAG: YgjV family protein [Clostridia bacterium]|nr:YgjV family protein [Clostridia bacterium]
MSKLHFLPIFFACYITVAVVFWKSWLDIIPLLTSLMFTCAFCVKNLQTMRWIVIVPNLLLVFYNILCRTYVSAVLGFIEVVVIVVAIMKFYKASKSLQNKIENTNSSELKNQE